MTDADRLAELFPCSRYVALFPAGMPRRACARRQVEMKREGKAWVPRKPFCALECPLAAETGAALAGIRMEPCSKCGGALIGEERCSTCQEASSLHTVQRRTPERPPSQERIWSGDAPDAPIAPPPRQDVGLTAEQVAEATERVRAATGQPTRVATPPRPPPSYRIDPAPRGAPHAEPAAPQAEEPPMRAARPASFEVGKPATQPEPQHQPPAQPAQETTMAGKPRTTPRPCCESMSNRHRAGCKEAGKPAAAKPTKKPAAAKRAKTAKDPGLHEGERRVPACLAAKVKEQVAASFSVLPLEQLEDEDLAKSIAQCRAELQRRKLDARARFEKLEEIERSIGEAA